MYATAYSNFTVYDGNAKERLGIAKVNLPDIDYMNVVNSGAGIAGETTTVLPGMVKAMQITLTWQAPTEYATELASSKKHAIVLETARVDDVNGDITTHSVRHYIEMTPTQISLGEIAPASTGDGSGQFAVHVWRAEIDGNLVIDIEPGNDKCVINGVDYAAPTRAAIGKS